MSARKPLPKLGEGKPPLKMVKKEPLKQDLTPAQIDAMFEKCKNWGRWGPDDQAGTLNHVQPDDIIAASRLIRKGKVFSLAIPFDANGPQFGGGFGGRYNPVHAMMATGTDAVTGAQGMEGEVGFGYADDMLMLPLQCASQWDGLGHVFYKGKMWNGYDAGLVDALGAAKNGIENVANRMVGRGVLLDIARFKGGDYLEPGYGISISDLEACAKAQGVEVRRGDFLICRTGMMKKVYFDGSWGSYAGGDAPGYRFETAEWLHKMEVAAIASDTWGCEVRPNETTACIQPWHLPVIPAMGISMGEIWYLEELADDCAADGVYEFFFVAPVLPVTGGVGSPVNPQAIK